MFEEGDLDKDWSALAGEGGARITEATLLRAAAACHVSLNPIEAQNMLVVAAEEGGGQDGRVTRDVLEQFVATLISRE